VTIKRFKEGKF